MANGTVRSLHICGKAGDSMTSPPAVHAVKGEGLEGDRYFNRTGTYSKTHRPDREVTLIEWETLEALQAELGYTLTTEESRRNLVTEGVSLDSLMGKTFRVGGEVVLYGEQPCIPCGYLEEITGKKVFEPLQGRGGLRASIVRGGTIRAGDVIEEVAEAEIAPEIPSPQSR